MSKKDKREKAKEEGKGEKMSESREAETISIKERTNQLSRQV